MAEIGYGYGSEWHLMRFMARHRELLENAVRQIVNERNGRFKWLDFEFSKNPRKPITGDIEIQGLQFLKKLIDNENLFQNILSEYKKTEINKINTWQSWDAVFELNKIIYLVEAKAHVGELRDDNIDGHGGSSKENIKNFIYDNLKEQNIFIKKENCIGPYYQLANRLATAAFLTNRGLQTRCIYIYFLNGYENQEDNKSVASSEIYLNEIHNEIVDLGLNPEELKSLLYHVFIDAKTGTLHNLEHQ